MLGNRKYILFFLITASLILYPLICLAEGEGRIIIKPLLSTSWEMHSNFYKAENNEKEVYAYVLQPGVDLGYQTAKSSVFLHYTLNSYWYDDRDQLLPGETAASEENYVGHTAVLKAESRPFDRLGLKLEDYFTKTRDPGQSDRFSDSIDRQEYWINRLTPSVLYAFGDKFTASLGYRNTITKYDQNLKEGSTENRGIFDLIYNFTPKRSLDLNYQYWQRGYDETTSTYTANQAMLIYRHQFNLLTLEAGAGYQSRDFDAPALSDISTLCYLVGIRWQNPPAPEAEPKTSFMASVDQNFSDSGIGDSYFKATRFTIGAGHIFLEKIPVGINGSYQRSDYETTTGLTPEGTTDLRKDNTLLISALKK